METSLEGLKPSEVFALHRPRMEFPNSSGTAPDIAGPCHAYSRCYVTICKLQTYINPLVYH